MERTREKFGRVKEDKMTEMRKRNREGRKEWKSGGDEREGRGERRGREGGG